MKTKLTRLLCLIALMLCLVLALAACADDKPCEEHTAGEAVTENEVAATCTDPGSYDEVVYCSRNGCGAEISRTTKTTPAAGHKGGEMVTVSEATCAAEGSKQIKCTVCQAVLASEAIPTLPHDFSTSNTCGECHYVWPASEGLTFFSGSEEGTSIVWGWGDFYGSELVIPYFDPDGRRVVSIQPAAFKGRTNYTKIVIPDSVTSIGDQAFFECSAVKSVTLPAGLTEIKPYAFGMCRALNEISIPAGVKTIGAGAFAFTAIASIVIPEGVTSISDDCFSGCQSLKSITLPSTLQQIGEDAFDLTKIKSIVIPEGVTTIGYGAFSGCSSLESITLPSTLTYIDSYCFWGCDRLKNVYISDLDAWRNVEFGATQANPMDYADNLYVNGVLWTEPSGES